MTTEELKVGDSISFKSLLGVPKMCKIQKINGELCVDEPGYGYRLLKHISNYEIIPLNPTIGQTK